MVVRELVWFQCITHFKLALHNLWSSVSPQKNIWVTSSFAILIVHLVYMIKVSKLSFIIECNCCKYILMNYSMKLSHVNHISDFLRMKNPKFVSLESLLFWYGSMFHCQVLYALDIHVWLVSYHLLVSRNIFCAFYKASYN